MTSPLSSWFSVIAVVVAGASACGGGTESTRYVLRVDRTLDSSRAVVEPFDDSAFKQHEPRDRYGVAVDGDHVTIDPLEGQPAGPAIEGTLVGTRPGESRYALDKGTFAGGRLLISGDRAELTIFGSGVPIVGSERGSLVRR